MPNMSLKKVPMPEQEPNVRNHNFQEVSLGYTKEMAMEEAARCLNCKHKPCVGGCPVNIRIPEFIAKVAEGDFQAAYDIISDTNALPSVSGRVCPQESQCEARCVRAIKGEPVAIGRLERFVADWYRENVNAMPQKPQTNGIKVAVVGSGPASLTCASDLAKHGYEVLPEGYLALPFVMFAQAISLLNSVRVGNTPDTPSPTGTVNRVVKGVTIHPFTA